MKIFKKWVLPVILAVAAALLLELVQVGILIAIAVGIGIIFKDKIGTFVNETFSALLGAKFS